MLFFAAIGFFEIIIFLVFLVLSSIGSIMKMVNEAKEQKKKQEEAAARRIAEKREPVYRADSVIRKKPAAPEKDPHGSDAPSYRKKKARAVETPLEIEEDDSQRQTSLTTLNSVIDNSLPSRSTFASEEPLADVSGLQSPTLPSENEYDAIYGSHESGEGKSMSPTLATELLKMFSSPQSVRQAVLLSEIFKRPYGP